MMTFRLAAAALLLCTGPFSLARAQEPARIDNGYVINAPWTQRPTAEQAHAAYPPFALEHDVAGKVELDCLVEADGALTCEVVSETPADRSFAGASIGLARFYRMDLSLPDGAPTAGLRARLNMSYAPPPPPPPPPAPAEPSLLAAPR